ncbi:MAG: ribonuclease J [Clostridia bacterium]|nr:ribonuclease J [Clostridia bacterium]
MTLLEYQNDMLIIDCGSSFPTADTPGVDKIIPDFGYVAENADKVRGLVITHGHEDHIGAVPYLMSKIPNLKIYASDLAAALIVHKVRERRLTEPKIITVSGGDRVRVSPNFDVEFIKVSHSISGAFALSINTPVGRIFHTGDYKIDYTPIDNQVMDLTRIAEIGDAGVTLMLGESTNVEKRGTTISERKVVETIERIFINNPDDRIIIATFASNVNRLQQIINICERHGRKVVVNGRSMVNVLQMAMELGIIKIKDGTLIAPEELRKYPKSNICIIATGSQGEPMSALTRMASGDDKLQVGPGDIVVISSQPIPGNEKLVYTVINNLYRCGAKVMYGALEDLHVSGHACQEELKLMLTLIKPKFFIPVHGEYRHLRQHEELAVGVGVKPSNIAIAEIGSRFKLTRNSLKPASAIEAGNVYVDGLTDVDSEILMDRKLLSNEGILMLLITITLADSTLNAPPEIIARGLQVDESAIEEMREQVTELLSSKPYKSADDRANFKRKVKRVLSRYMDFKFRQKPMILPIIIEL